MVVVGVVVAVEVAVEVAVVLPSGLKLLALAVHVCIPWGVRQTMG
jgi:hypothetical protein